MFQCRWGGLAFNWLFSCHLNPCLEPRPWILKLNSELLLSAAVYQLIVKFYLCVKLDGNLPTHMYIFAEPNLEKVKTIRRIRHYRSSSHVQVLVSYRSVLLFSLGCVVCLYMLIYTSIHSCLLLCHVLPVSKPKLQTQTQNLNSVH